jgi:hypothetical protein
LCSKITFLPVLVAFLLVERGWNRRLQSALWVVGFSLLWTIPIWAKYERVIAWFWGLAARQGPYGLGPSGMVSPVSLGSGVTQLLVDNPLYLASLVAGLAPLAALRWGRAWDRVRAESSVRVLVGLLVGGCIQLLMSAKHPQSRYLAPSLGLAGLVWAAVFVAMSRAQLLRLTARTVWVGRLAAVVAACTLAIHQVALYRLSDRNSRERGRLSQLISGQREGARIFYYGASSPAYALIFGTSFSGQQYFRIIEKLIESGTCQTYLFNNWTGEFYSLRGPVTFDQIAAGGGPILLHGDVLSEPERAKLPAGVTLHELARAGDETIHELRRSQQQAAVGQAP